MSTAAKIYIRTPVRTAARMIVEVGMLFNSVEPDHGQICICVSSAMCTLSYRLKIKLHTTFTYSHLEVGGGGGGGG